MHGQRVAKRIKYLREKAKRKGIFAEGADARSMKLMPARQSAR
jgi:hypothetical protein